MDCVSVRSHNFKVRLGAKTIMSIGNKVGPNFLKEEENSSHFALNFSKLQTLSSNEYGRYLVAACDIPEKTVILLESVIIHAPADDVKKKSAAPTNLCLACCRPCERNCEACNWCICSTECEKVTPHSQF